MSGALTPAAGSVITPVAGAATVPLITVWTVWGIDSQGGPYYAPAGAAPGEGAVLTFNSEGRPTLTRIAGGT